MDDLQNKTNSVHLRIMEVVAYSFVLIYAAITVSAILSNEKDLLSSMKDATVNIAMIIIGYIFGSSAGSKAKSAASASGPEGQPATLPPPASSGDSTIKSIALALTVTCALGLSACSAMPKFSEVAPTLCTFATNEEARSAVVNLSARLPEGDDKRKIMAKLDMANDSAEAVCLWIKALEAQQPVP